MTPQELERETKAFADEYWSKPINFGVHDRQVALDAWLASAERFGWKRFDAKDESTFPKQGKEYVVRFPKYGEHYKATWDGKQWSVVGEVLAYYELPTFEQEKL